MSVSLIGLAALQFYWIREAVQVNRERFHQDVHHALENIAKRIEQYEVRSETQKKLTELTQYTTGNGYTLILGENTEAHMSTDERLEGTNEISILQGNRKVKKVRFFDKSEVVRLILDAVSSTPETIEDRVSQHALDSIINHEFLNKGIKPDYEYVVLDRTNYKIAFDNFEGEGAQSGNILKSKFSVQLFPNDFWSAENYLYVSFPEESRYIIGTMWALLASSVVFIGLVLICFTIAIYMILKQKKISEVTHDFINNMTHEFKTPLATIALACEVMQDDTIRMMPKQMDRYITMVDDESQRLRKQVEKVLQIARLDRGDFKLKVQSLDIHDIINKAVQNIEIQVTSRGGEINKTFKAANTKIEGDEVHITNIISNLLDNANKYSPEKPDIEVSTHSVRKGIKIRIKDKGQGISKDQLKRVFDKFYRVPTGNVHDIKGFGLGLSYVKNMIDAHFGNISVKSEPNKGSTFTIFLPYKHEAS